MIEGQTEGLNPDEQLFNDAFKAIPIGIALEDLEGRPLFANPALCAMLGLSEAEMRRKHCVEFSPPEDAEKDWALFERLIAGSIDHYSLDKRFVHRDGSLIWGRLTISLLKGRTPAFVVAMVEDVTEKRTALEILRRSKGYLAEAERLTHTGSWAWNMRTRDAFWSKEMFRIVGQDPEKTRPSPTHFGC